MSSNLNPNAVCLQAVPDTGASPLLISVSVNNTTKPLGNLPCRISMYRITINGWNYRETFTLSLT